MTELINPEVDIKEISDSLRNHHSLFSAFYEIDAKIEFREDINTAAIQFYEGKPITFLFNSVFYREIDNYMRNFVICHEMCHIFYQHGSRGINLKERVYMGGSLILLSNIAADLVVNHSLIDNFGFDRNKIKNWERYIWRDTVIKDKVLPPNLSFEEYYSILLKWKDSLEPVLLIDDHSDFGEGDIEVNIDKVVEDLLESEEVTREELKDFNRKSVGNASFNTESEIKIGEVKSKKSWNDIFKDYVKEKRGPKKLPKLQDQWLIKNRRMSLVGNELFLPSQVEIQPDKPEKFLITLFLDVSGSCVELKRDFWAAARSIPEDDFEIEAYSFANRTWKLDLSSNKIQGSGGTSFSCIESRLNILEADKGKYPDIVLVITDGEATTPKVKKPENWLFCLSQKYFKGIPKGSKYILLQDINK